MRLMPVPPGIAQWMTFNVGRPPFDNAKLRAAVNAGIDRTQLMRAITRGYGAVTPTFVPPSEWAFDGALRAPTFDPARVKRLLSEAGKPNGFEATLSIIQRDPDTQVAQLVQAQLRPLGIQLKIEVLERQAWVPKVLGHQHEAAMGRVNVPRADPDQVFGPLLRPRRRPELVGHQRPGGVRRGRRGEAGDRPGRAQDALCQDAATAARPRLLRLAVLP